MGFFKKLFGSKNNENRIIQSKAPLDLESLLNSKDINSSIIEFDNLIGDRCSYGDDIDELIASQKTFYLNQNIEREINNGGFKQYFINSSGDFAQETVESLEKIGATKTAAILTKAIEQFPNKFVPKDYNKRMELVEQVEENANVKWEELDNLFYNYEDDLNQLNIEFIKRNKEDFKSLF